MGKSKPTPVNNSVENVSSEKAENILTICSQLNDHAIWEFTHFRCGHARVDCTLKMCSDCKTFFLGCIRCDFKRCSYCQRREDKRLLENLQTTVAKL
jgi:hypothetical protein